MLVVGGPRKSQSGLYVKSQPAICAVKFTRNTRNVRTFGLHQNAGGTPNLIPSLSGQSKRKHSYCNYKWVGRLRRSISGGPRGADPPRRKEIKPSGPQTLYRLKL